MTSKLFSAVLLSLALGMASATIAAAQPTDQPDESIRVRPRSTLDVSVDLFAAIDDTFGSVADAPAEEVVIDTGSRTFWGGNSQLTYERAAQRVTFAANAAASFRQFSQLEDGLQPGYSGSMQLAGPLGRRTNWEVRQTLSYGPTNALPFFGVQELGQTSNTIPLVDYSVSSIDRATTSSRGSLSYNVSRRGTLTTALGIDYAASPDDSESSAGGFRRWDASGRYTHQLSRYANWYAGYGLTANGFTSTVDDVVTTPRMHSLDLGVAYNRPLSFSRRTRVSMRAGSQIIQHAATNAREWRASGSAGLERQLGRTWAANLFYVRDSRFVPAFADPVLNDAITAQVGGRVTSKSSVSLLANYSTGSVGLATGSNGYRGKSASANYRYAFLQRMALYVEYFLFDFEFDSGVVLSDTLFSSSRRHGVRLGVSIGTGLWGQRRRVTVDGENAQ